MNKRNGLPIGDIELSRYLDGELTPNERFDVEKRLEGSPESREALMRLQEISCVVRETTYLHLTPEEEADFDAILNRRLQSVSTHYPLRHKVVAPFQFLWGLSWQWQAALAVTICLICYIPVLLQTPLDYGPDTVPLIDSDYSNYDTFFSADPEAGYDLYGVIPRKKEEPKPEKTPIPEENAPIGFHSSYRA